MKQHVFAVYDSKAEIFHNPIFFKAKGEALRSFADEVNREGSNMNKHPADYTMFLIGTYDVELGHLESNSTPVSMGLAHDFLEQDKPENLFKYQKEA